MNKTKSLQKPEGENRGIEIQTGRVSGSQDGTEGIQNIHSKLDELDWSLASSLQML
jgi:hypothetical protein